MEPSIKPRQKHLNMNTNTNNIGYYLKTSFLAVAIFIESFVLSNLIMNFVRTKNVFTVDAQFSIKIVLLMLLMAYTFALTMGGWRKWEQYLFIPLPVTLGVFFSMIMVIPTYAVLIALGFLLLLMYDVYKSTRLKSLLVKIDPKMILRFSTKGLLFLFSILGGVLVILGTADIEPVNMGEKIAEFAKEPMENIIRSELPEEAHQQLLGNGNLKQMTETQINNLIEPYRNMVNPLIAIMTFGLFQLYASIAYILYMLTIDLIYLLMKKTGFFKIEIVSVNQEQLKF